VLGSGLYLWLKRRNVAIEDFVRASRDEELESVAPRPAVVRRESA
jgi:hypothetical protein